MRFSWHATLWLQLKKHLTLSNMRACMRSREGWPQRLVWLQLLPWMDTEFSGRTLDFASCYAAVLLGSFWRLLTTIALIMRKKHCSGLEWLAVLAFCWQLWGWDSAWGTVMRTRQGFPPCFCCVALATVLASLRAYRFYKEFTVTFAVTVWRDFFVAGRKKPDPPADQQPGGSGV